MLLFLSLLLLPSLETLPTVLSWVLLLWWWWFGQQECERVGETGHGVRDGEKAYDNAR